MKRVIRHVVFGLATLPLLAMSADIDWCSSRTNATQRALDSGHLILLMAGRATCGNCQYMKGTVCESGSVRPAIDKNYVCWFCPVDDSTEWHVYAGGLGTFSLPLLCVIEPGNPTAYLDRTTAIQHEDDFRQRLLSHLPDHQPRITAVETYASDIQFHFLGLSNCSYRVLRATNLLGKWTASGALITGSGTAMTDQTPNTASQTFFRLLGFR